MKAIARRNARTAFTHRIDIRSHQVTADEPTEHGGDDEGPSPQEFLAASLASCTAITMEMYAKRKGWDIGQLEVMCNYTPAERGCPTKFKVELRIANGCTQDQIEKLTKKLEDPTSGRPKLKKEMEDLEAVKKELEERRTELKGLTKAMDAASKERNKLLADQELLRKRLQQLNPSGVGKLGASWPFFPGFDWGTMFGTSFGKS